MLVAKRQVIPEKPGMRREHCSQPRCSSWDELDFFFKRKNKHSITYGRWARKI